MKNFFTAKPIEMLAASALRKGMSEEAKLHKEFLLDSLCINKLDYFHAVPL